MTVLEFNLKNKIIKILIVFSYIISWLSVSTSYEDLLILNHSEINFIQIINFFRHFLVYMCLISIIIFLIFNKRILIKIDKIYFLFFLYFISQVPGLIFTDNSYNNISLIISAINITLTCALITKFFSEKEKMLFLSISILILITVLFVAFGPQLKQFLEGIRNLYGSSFTNSEIFLNKNSPRSSGLSRTCLVIVLLLHALKNDYLKNKSLLMQVFKILFLTIILLYQSRLIIFLAILSYLLIYVFENNYTLKSVTKFVSLNFLLPVSITILLFSFFSSQNYKYKLSHLKKTQDPTHFEEVTKKRPDIYGEKPIRKFTVSFSSGRFQDWKQILHKISNDKIFFGYGSQGDRYLINQTASNGFVYAYASSGIIGLFFYVLIITIVSFYSFKIILNYKHVNKTNLYLSLIIWVLFLRSLVESSFAVFGIDLLLILTSWIIINNNSKIENHQ